MDAKSVLQSKETTVKENEVFFLFHVYMFLQSEP